MNFLFSLLGVLLVSVLAWMGFSLHNEGILNARIATIEEKKLSVEEEKLSIEKEKHIDNLYSIYQENMNICKNNAFTQGKDAGYVKENCTKIINDSIIANWLKDRGYGYLIKED